MSITRSELADLAYAAMTDRMNRSNGSGGAPYGSGNGLQCNQDLLVAYPNPPAQMYLGNYQSDRIVQQEMVNACRALAAAYAPVVTGLYGIAGNWPQGTRTPDDEQDNPFVGFAYDAVEIFAVNPGYHAGHYNQLMDWINTMGYPEMAGNVTKSSITIFLERLLDLLFRARGNEQPDLRICHSSCHSSCHSARGRR